MSVLGPPSQAPVPAPSRLRRRRASRARQEEGSWARQQGRSGQRILDALALVVSLVLAAWAAWPIYGTTRYLIAVAVAVVLGAGVATLMAVRRLPWWGATLLVAGAYLVAVIPAAIPSALWGFPDNLAFGLQQATTAPVTAWRQLATVALPVGSFEALLVPAFVVFYAVAALCYTAVWRSPRFVPLAAVGTGLALTFGLVMGRAAPSAAHTFFGQRLEQPREVLTGALWLIVTALWLSWRARLGRRRVAAVSSEGGTSKVRRTALLTRATAGVAMVTAAVVVAGLLAPGWAQDRTVARSVVNPATVQPPEVSPLSSFRSYFTPSGLKRQLFTVTGVPTGTTVRLATLEHYDGETFTASDPAQPQSGFRQLAFRLDDVPGAKLHAQVTIDDYTDVWLPTLGQLTQVAFKGADARQLTSALYVDPRTTGALNFAVRPAAAQPSSGSSGAVQSDTVRGLQSGDTYQLTYANLPSGSSTAGPANLVSPISAQDYPQLFAWIKGTGLSGGTVSDVQALVDQMMLRSYLGHSLTDPTAAGTTTWLSDLPAQANGEPYAFRPSYAGHSMKTIEDQVFAPMNESTVVCSETITQCAATVGDQEQYAVAAALIAQASGFPARVVLGAVVPDDEVVRGSMVTAWTEIQTSQGTWVPLTVEPRVDNSFVESETVAEPQTYQTPVDRQDAQQLEPPDQKAQTGATGSQQGSQESATGTVEARWVHLVMWGASGLIVLLVLCSPFLMVLLIKARRRRRRRGATDPETKIAAGWQEYVDRAVDTGLISPGHRTRSEIAEIYGGSRSADLAERADRAVFADHDPHPQAGEEYWQIVAAEVSDLHREQSRYRRWRSRLSWASLRRSR